MSWRCQMCQKLTDDEINQIFISNESSGVKRDSEGRYVVPEEQTEYCDTFVVEPIAFIPSLCDACMTVFWDLFSRLVDPGPPYPPCHVGDCPVDTRQEKLNIIPDGLSVS